MPEAGKYILVVDDVAFMRRMLTTMLKSLGYETQEAEDARAAVAKIAASPPCLIFLDLEMPQTTGLELLKLLRVNESFQSIPVIVCTAKAERKSIDAALKLGVVDYLCKPIDRKMVEARVKKHLGESESVISD